MVVVDTAGRLLGIVYGDLTGLQLLLQEIRIDFSTRKQQLLNYTKVRKKGSMGFNVMGFHIDPMSLIAACAKSEF